MKRFHRILCLLFLFSESPAQNLFPNPGFELYDQCPTYTSQINRCTEWDSAIGTSDYYNCGYYAWSTIGSYGNPRTGDGVIGLVCSAPSVWNPNAQWYGETFKGPLLQTLVPGATYRVKSHWYCTTTNLPPPADFCFSIGFYFYKSTHPPQAGLQGCASFRPQVTIDPSQVPVSSYAEFIVDFIADSCYDAVMIGLFCNDSTFTPACLQNGDTDYFDVDDISLTKVADAPVTTSNFTVDKTRICEGECLHFYDTSDTNRYARTWFFDGSSTPSSNAIEPTNICYPNAGQYDVTLITAFECGSDTVVKEDYITVEAFPVLSVSSDTVLTCYGTEKELSASSNSPLYWSTGETGPVIVVQFPGNYMVTAANGCGEVTDTLVVDFEKCPCRVWVPNAFTPNSDSKNEAFAVYSDCILTNFRLRIYNRWGQEVFKSESPLAVWDGRFGNGEAPEGMYLARVQYEGYDEGRSREKVILQPVFLIR